MRVTRVSSLLLFVFLTCAPAALAHVTVVAPVQKPDGGVAADNGADLAADEIWMVSTRHSNCASGKLAEPANFRFFRFGPGCRWQAADEAEWIASQQADAVTLVYVHGNRVASNEASGRGLAAYRAVVRNRPDSSPIRFVIWSWPSSKLHGPRPRRDAQVKAARTDCESLLLASFLTQLDSQTPISLLGYSFGARIVSGALHLAAGGRLGRYQLADADHRPTNSMRVVLYAAAMDNHWWLPGRYHGQSFSQVDRLLLLYNTCDPVLRLYPKMDRHSSAQALGFTGFARPAALGPDAARLEQANVRGQIGRTHDEQAYLASESIMRRMRDMLLAP